MTEESDLGTPAEELEADVQEVAADLEDDKADAVAALGEAAEESLDLREVELSDELTLRVKDRIDPRAERMQQRSERAMDRGDEQKAARHAAHALAYQVVEPDEYQDPEVWRAAVGKYGTHFVLVECTTEILDPAIQNARDAQKKYEQ